ncbi:type II toxin-antitoxin system VapC family toxin [Microbacterium sp. SA39]|uniref:type II toxin-antitoxin system VapC family toxin n=1 Tax=Microbacterium sp. SA39 TaxID=1263625 RepID=UPI0005FA0097|nr:type II toxin-antitoxin system VapC family toxin [Microbacterium sp. SA39]KJQ54484.1 tRNA(fMet)-specific endonuclease VapC [Microbacterium sp. SA39]
MIVYFDTSAFIPLLLQEPGTPVAARLWDEGAAVFSSRLIIVETAAAIAMGQRMNRVSWSEADALREASGELLRQLTLIEAAPTVVEAAAELASRHGLRGYDAMHLASVSMVLTPGVLIASGDHRLLEAALAEGFGTVDTSGRS